MLDKKELKKLRRKAINLQNKLYPKKISMSEAMNIARKGNDDA